MDCTSSAGKPQTVFVLVVSHADGYLEVFGPQNVQAKIVTMMQTHSQQAECLAEDVLRLSLPQKYRDIYWRDHVRTTGSTRPVTVADVAAAEYDRKILNVLRSAASVPAEVASWVL